MNKAYNDLIYNEITPKDNIMLSQMPLVGEIYNTLKSMNPYRALSFDGYFGGILPRMLGHCFNISD